MNVAGIASAAFALLVWGVTFANTRALLMDFSALEIMVVPFAMAWTVLWGKERVGKKVGRESRWTVEGLSYSDAVSHRVYECGNDLAICSHAAFRRKCN